MLDAGKGRQEALTQLKPRGLTKTLLRSTLYAEDALIMMWPQNYQEFKTSQFFVHQCFCLVMN